VDGAGYQVAELAGGKLEELGQVAWVATLINGLKILKIQVTVENLFLFCLWVDTKRPKCSMGSNYRPYRHYITTFCDTLSRLLKITTTSDHPTIRSLLFPMLRCRGESWRTGSWFDVNPDRHKMHRIKRINCTSQISIMFHWFSTIQHQPIPPKFCFFFFFKESLPKQVFLLCPWSFITLGGLGGLHFDASWIDTAKSEHVLSQLADSFCTVHNYSPPTTSSRNERTHCSHKTKLCSLQDATDV